MLWKSAGKRAAAKQRSAPFLFTRLAFQNLLRKPARTVMLIVAVALGTGAVFASSVVGRGIEASVEKSLARLGADLIVVPEKAMVNITSALLTVQPTEAAFDSSLVDRIAGLPGVARVAPQTIYRVPMMAGMPEHKSNLIAFDPERDFTVLPWVQSRLSRSLETGDLIVGGRRTENVGDEINPCNVTSTVYAKLGRSGVGPFDESIFASYETVAKLCCAAGGTSGAIPPFHPERVSAALVRLSFGATAEQVRFTIAGIKGVKVVSTSTILTSSRQATNALMAGMLGFAALMLAGSLIMVGLLFSAIISERRRELGLLKAVGTRRGDMIRMLVMEAGFATGLGGLLGLLFGGGLLLVFQNSLVYHLELMRVDFSWPTGAEIAAAAVTCAILAASVGVSGALVPAWRVGGKEACALMQGEGG